MPSRVVRGDNLLESGRYMRLPDEQKVFYVHVLLAADDFGLLSMAPLIVRKLFFKPPSDARVMKLARALEAVDLVRIYEHDQVFYLFVPRFSQRMKSFRSKCPMPPVSIYADDRHASENFNKFKSQFKKLATGGGGPATTGGGRRPDLDLDSDLISSHLDLEVARASTGGQEPATPEQAEPLFHKDKNGHGKSVDERAAELGITREPGEGIAVFKARIAAATGKSRGEGGA